MTKTEDQRKADFAEKLAYWRKHGAPGVISDQACTPFVSMADGKTYDSKSEYRKSLKSLGYEELGNDKIEKQKPKDDSEEIITDLKRAMGEL